MMCMTNTDNNDTSKAQQTQRSKRKKEDTPITTRHARTRKD